MSVMNYYFSPSVVCAQRFLNNITGFSKTQLLLLSVEMRTLCALATGHRAESSTLNPFPTSVLYAVSDLHLLVHLQTLSLTFCVGLLLLGVRLLALAVRRRGVHYYSRVRYCSGVWRCGVCHRVGGVAAPMRHSKNVTPGREVQALN